MSGTASSVRPNQRFSKDRSCPICGGHDQERRAEGKRCYGFVSEDGEWAHCTREEYAGEAPYNAKSAAYVHKLGGVCRCGERHGLGSEASKGRDKSSKVRIAKTYDYRGEHGQLLYQTVRLEPKGFYQRRPDGSGDWIHNLQGVRRVLYGLPELLAADEGEPVFVFEGEKDVDLARSLGLVATTNVGGAGKWKAEYSDDLHGRRVAVVPDNDAPGRKHSEEVARSLYGKAKSVKVVELPGLPERDDFSDWTDTPTNGPVELRRLWLGAEEWRPPEERDEGRVLIWRAIREGIDPPAVLVDDVLLEGKAHAIYSGPGLGKTYLMLWVALEVVRRGAPVLVFDAENGIHTIAPRVEALGADIERGDELLHYYPWVSLPTTEEGRLAYEAKLDRIKPALVCFDSWLSFLASSGLDENSSNDIATFAAHYIQPAKSRGVATLMLDHVPHQGKHARGSTRKKDEVDVQWSLTQLQPFDRERVGQIALRREKDREGWLPRDVTFLVGGTSNGKFIFSQSAGTFEAEGDDGLKESERKTLQALRGFGESGAKAAEWRKAATELEVKERTFWNAVQRLRRKGYALQENKRWYISTANNCKPTAMQQKAAAPSTTATTAPPLRGAVGCSTVPLGEVEDAFDGLEDIFASDTGGGE